MDKEKAQAYEIVGDIIIKGIVVVFMMVGWLWLIAKTIENPTIPMGIAVSNVPALMMIIVQHYFGRKR